MNELVKINDNNQVTTDSLTVADRFGKRHRDVLRSIKLLKCSKDFNARNFAPVEYKDQKGEKRTYYDMTQDGWMFLVMGFTGEKAAEWKEKFIVAFRAMEAELRKRQDKPVIVSEHTRSLPSGKKEIVLSEKAKAEIGGIVKSCVAFAVREELAAIMSGSGKTEYWEVSDRDLLYQLYHWHATKNKKDTLEFRRLHAENDRLAAENADLKNRMSQISSWVR